MEVKELIKTKSSEYSLISVKMKELGKTEYSWENIARKYNELWNK